jgi:hypothetical protein
VRFCAQKELEATARGGDVEEARGWFESSRFWAETHPGVAGFVRALQRICGEVKWTIGQCGSAPGGELWGIADVQLEDRGGKRGWNDVETLTKL